MSSMNIFVNMGTSFSTVGWLVGWLVGCGLIFKISDFFYSFMSCVPFKTIFCTIRINWRVIPTIGQLNWWLLLVMTFKVRVGLSHRIRCCLMQCCGRGFTGSQALSILSSSQPWNAVFLIKFEPTTREVTSLSLISWTEWVYEWLGGCVGWQVGSCQITQNWINPDLIESLSILFSSQPWNVVSKEIEPTTREVMSLSLIS